MNSIPEGVAIRAYDPERDAAWATNLLGGALAGRMQARRGELVDVLDAEGLVGSLEGRPVGLLTFRPDDASSIELAALAVAEPEHGIGSALIEAVLDAVRRRGIGRVWVVTTNDNLAALRLYQRRGFRIAAVRPGAVDRARATLKPGIPGVAANGIPIRDEIELEIVFERDP